MNIEGIARIHVFCLKEPQEFIVYLWALARRSRGIAWSNDGSASPWR